MIIKLTSLLALITLATLCVLLNYANAKQPATELCLAEPMVIYPGYALTAGRFTPTRSHASSVEYASRHAVSPPHDQLRSIELHTHGRVQALCINSRNEGALCRVLNTTPRCTEHTSVNRS